MGAAASAKVNVEELNPGLGRFLETFQGLSVKGKGGLSARIAAWKSIDYNGNGIVSLAECDNWIKGMLQASFADDEDKEGYQEVWRRYRPSYIRAFNDAKDIAPAAREGEITEGKETSTADYVTKKEFRLFNAYICIYACMYESFTMLDGVTPESTEEITSGSNDDDRRIELKEFTENFDRITGKFGFQAIIDCGDEVGDGKIFNKIDADGKGMVLLKEWCAWIEKAEQAAGTAIGKALAVGDD